MRTLLRSNLTRLGVLLWFSAWLLVVMPGHKRGIVQLPDAKAQAVEVDAAQVKTADAQPASCCKPKPTCCETPASEPGSDSDCEQPPGDPARHCAICFLKAHLTDPPPITLYTPFLGELDELAFLVEHSIADSQAAPMNLRGRAPPA